ncbi:MAG: ribonuclease T2 [Amylibacter sp.]|nr:ribonuclease T2 [Amylibacter sp.]
MLRTVFALLLMTLPAHAEGEAAGDFDYYVMSLSWTPTWCDLKGDARQSPQCQRGRGYGFTLHGLWPQYTDRGYPSYCRTAARNPSRAMSNAMADIMGTSGLAWYQWKKHGRCAGLSAQDYYTLARKAYASIKRPEIFRKLKSDVTLPAAVIEAAFIEANPTLKRDQITITCKAHKIQEVRICLTKDLELETCGYDVSRDCGLRDAGMGMIK